MIRRRTLHLPTLLAAVLIASCAAAVLVVSEKAQATFPGKNGKIAFSSYDGHNFEIYAINPGGGGKYRVTNTDRYEFNPSWSPDGKKIAYTRYDGNFDDYIYTINVRGGGGSRVTEGSDPSWSPDGEKIAYDAYDGHDSEIYTIDARGGASSTSPTTTRTMPSPTGRPTAGG